MSEQGILRKRQPLLETGFSVWAVHRRGWKSNPSRIEDACGGTRRKTASSSKPLEFHETCERRSFLRTMNSRHSLYREVLYRQLSRREPVEVHRLLGAAGQDAYGTPSQNQKLAAELALYISRVAREYDQAISYLITCLREKRPPGRFRFTGIRSSLLRHALGLCCQT